MSRRRFSAIPTRLAIEGEELIVHVFADGSAGFASARDAQKNWGPRHIPPPNRSLERILKKCLHIFDSAESVPEIYVPFGTYLILKNIPPDIQQKCGVQCKEAVIFSRVATFAGPYRDGLDFPNGSHIALRDLPEGTPLEVLSLASSDLLICERDLATRAEI